MTRDELAQAMLTRYGRAHQLTKLQEECGELVAAISRYLQDKCSDTERWNDLVNELADISLMLDQMEVLFGKGNIDYKIETKKRRTEERENFHEDKSPKPPGEPPAHH